VLLTIFCICPKFDICTVNRLSTVNFELLHWKINQYYFNYQQCEIQNINIIEGIKI
jgi:hypothetical protein